MQSFALIKDGKLVQVTTDSNAITASLESGQATSVHAVANLEEVQSLLDGKPKPKAEEDAGDKIIEGLDRLLVVAEARTVECLQRAKSLGQVAQEKTSGILTRIRKELSDAADEVRSTIHEATKPKKE